jgi:DNA invertase Pin-like site-specific DNA recombinase
MRTEDANLSGIAYSYIRFSSREQEQGDSLRRQTELRDAWLSRHKAVTLDTSLTLRDLGVSGFRGRHRGDKHALGAFLNMVESGRIKPGTFLIVENLDRLTREDELEATHLFTGLLLKGVRLVQLEPETVFDRDAGQLEIMRAILELGRGHAESARKSFRVSQAWDQKKKRAAEGAGVITRKCPAWLELRDGEFRFKPGARAVLRRTFALCSGGVGCLAIASRFNAEGVPTFSGFATWEEAYLRKIIAGRAVLGEHQPMKGRRGERQLDGKPLLGYFPAAVTEAEWFAAKAATAARQGRGGRPSTVQVNPFQGLLRDARGGGPVYISSRLDDYRQPYRVLMPGGNRRGHGGKGISFPYEVFERAILSKLREVDPRDVLPGDDPAADEALELAGRLGDVERRQADIKAEFMSGRQAAMLLNQLAVELETERERLAAALAAARVKAASPLSEAWGEFGTLAAAVEKATDPRDARTRLRGVLRRMVAGIYCLFVGRGNTRYAAVQVWFTEGGHRDYLIRHKPRPSNTAKGQPRFPEPHVRSFAGPAVEGEFDLRDREDAAAMERALLAIVMDS